MKRVAQKRYPQRIKHYQMNFHQTVLNQLKKYRETNPNFNFLVRQREGSHNRFDSGHWFQGGDDSAIVPLVNVKGTGSRQKSIVLLFNQQDEELKCTLQIRFDAEKRKKLIECYKTIVNQIGGFTTKGDSGYDKELGVLSSEFSELNTFLDTHYSYIISILKSNGFEEELITNKKFIELMDNLDEKLNEIRPEIITEFVDWFFSFPVKKYKSLSKETLIEELIEANEFFKIDIFNVSEANYLDVISHLNQNRNISDTPFFNFSKNIGNHRPRAILGKDNYFRFLKEKFKISNGAAVQSYQKTPLNQILYGPPGTGKTYATINAAVTIANPYFDIYQERDILKKEFNRLTKEGQIVFTTFHQSMSYEDFVEGIKPVLNQDNKELAYEIQDGIFKAIADKAKGIDGEIKATPSDINFRNCNYFKMSVGGKNRKDVHDWCIANNQVALGYGGNNNLNLIDSQDWKSYKKEFQETLPEIVEQSSYSITATHAFKYWMKKGDIIMISLGNHIIDAIGVVKGDYQYVEIPEFPYHHIREVEWIATDLDANPSLFVDKKISQQTIYQFNNDDIKIEYLESITSKKTNTKSIQNYVIIIDEINRGNVSAIFGELITLLEEDKRKGNEESLSVTLPYSQEQFSVPKNLYIIGTMNTADRSVEALDTALRRRFEFKEMMPDYSVIEKEEVKGIKLAEVLNTINNRIEVLIDRDHTIGHSYFVGVNTKEKLVNAFKNKIVPLLQEYFYGDYGKIGLVLGKGFVEIKENKNLNFSSFRYEGKTDLISSTYILKPIDASNIIAAVTDLMATEDN